MHEAPCQRPDWELVGNHRGHQPDILGVAHLSPRSWAAALARRVRQLSATQPRRAGRLPSRPWRRPKDDIAVIAAAVYAMLGAHRIVHLEAESQGQAWAVEGRWMQQTSHTTRP